MHAYAFDNRLVIDFLTRATPTGIYPGAKKNNHSTHDYGTAKDSAHRTINDSLAVLEQEKRKSLIQKRIYSFLNNKKTPTNDTYRGFLEFVL